MEQSNASSFRERGRWGYAGRPRHLVRALRLNQIITSSTQPPDYVALAKLLGISRRTLFRDLSLLRSAGVESFHHRRNRPLRMEAIAEALGQALTLREAGALLELLEHNRQPKAGSAYDQALRPAKHKVILALRKECSAMMDQLDAVFFMFQNE